VPDFDRLPPPTREVWSYGPDGTTATASESKPTCPAGAARPGNLRCVSWSWRYEDESGSELPRTATEAFGSKADAESWLGESWRELLGSGVQQVILLEDGRVEYGPMPLTPVE
jgi:hypothetical protein